MAKQFKRTLAFVLMLVMSICAVTFQAGAAEIYECGKCGDNVNYILDDNGILIISGKGEMYDYSILYGEEDSSPFCASGLIKSIVIKNGVTTIGRGMFIGCKNMINVTIPNSVVKINDYAFEDCENLTNVTIPDSVTEINDCAFAGCKKLSTITIPNSVLSVGDWVFGQCEKLTSITIGNGVTSIGDSLSGCKSLSNITVGNKNKSYSSQDGVLFNKDKTELIKYPVGNKRSKYAIPNGVNKVGSGAFMNGSNLTDITISKSVMSIGDYAFCECVKLVSVSIPDSVKSIGNNIFDGCIKLTSVEVPKNITSIGHCMFRDCKSLANITIPSKVKSIGDRAFYSCDSLKSVIIPNSVTNIGESSFEDCDNLTNITLGNSVTYIGMFTFAECESLKSVKIPNSVTVLGQFAFAYCTSLKSVLLEEGIKDIGPLAFSDCKNLKSVIIPNSVKNIGDYAFGYYDGFTKLSNFTIRGFKNSAAEKYAKANGFKFVDITPKSISKFTFSSLKSAVYTGKAIAPKIVVKNGKTTLKAGTHYTVSYKNNTKIGKATVTIKGVEKSGYSGTKTLTFNILPGVTKSLKATQSTSAIKLTWSKVAGATGYRVFRYDTKTKKWVKLADTKNTTYTVSKLKAGTNYKYAVKAYTTVGKTVYWSATYAQISTATKPATPTVKVSAGKKQAALSWNKVTGASGYVVYYSTSKNGEYKKLAITKNNSYTAKKLTTGKTYYFKVTAYKTVGKSNIYGAYSAVNGVKVK